MNDEYNPLLHQASDLLENDLTPRNSSLKQRIKKWLINFDNRKRRLVLVSLLAAVSVAICRARRQQSTNKGKSSFWPVALMVAWWQGPEYRRNPRESTMSLLLSAAKEGVIRQAWLGSSTIYFQTQEPGNNIKRINHWNRAKLPSENNSSIKSGLVEALVKGGCNDVQAIPESIASKMATPVLAALPFLYLGLLYRLLKNQFGGEDISSQLTNGTRKLWGDEESDRTTFRDVAGLASVVEDMQEVVSYLTDPSIYQALGARPPRGILLHGPPGSGKTLLARAVAGEARCDSFTAVSGSAFVEMYVGRGAARVRSLFEKARRDALRRRKLSLATSWWSTLLGVSTKPMEARPPVAVIFIDELDAVGKSRSYDGIHGNDEREQTLNQLLTEMDGFSTGTSGGTENQTDNKEEEVTLIVIAASNRVDVIDPAVLRRFDRQILVGYPDAGGRKEILKVHARKIQCSVDIDWGDIACDDVTDNFSGADLRNVINEAALFAIREKSSVVKRSHLMHAANRIKLMKSKTAQGSTGRPFIPTFLTSID